MLMERRGKVLAHPNELKIPPRAVGGLFRSALLATLLSDSDAPRMNLPNMTLLHSRRVEV